MAVEPARTGSDPSLPTLIAELWELIKTYVRQETVDPIRGVGRFVIFGVAGALLVGTGAVLLAVGVLRLLQTETDTTFTGNWSWAPYGIVVVALVAGGAWSLSAIGGRRDRREGA
ncbi:MAG: hypothetical protein HYU28_03605 [Actinobacteria bacterium]|nr:hypothetical protein [Actinomycetota bacterium]